MRKFNEDAYKVYNNIDSKDCGVFGSWDEVQQFLNAEWGSYTASMAKENATFTDEDKDNFFGNYSFDLVPVEEPADEVCADCEEPCADCEEVEVPAEEPEYVEIEGVTADPEKVVPDQTLVFTDKEAQAINDLEDGEKMLLPNMQPDTEYEYQNVGGATEIVKVDDMDDLSGTAEEIVSQDSNDIEEFISLLLDDEGECEDCACVEIEPAPEVVVVVDECKKTDKKEEKQPMKEDAKYIISAFLKDGTVNQETAEDIIEAVDKYKAMATDAYKELVDCTQAENTILKSEGEKPQVAAQESFKDGVITDINELDFPAAMHDAVDTKEDGSLLRLSDVVKQVAELKEFIMKDLADFKNDLKTEVKTSLSDLKQDIKSDVKDVQTAVTSKLDNTDARIADLTAEEEELDLEEETPSEDELNLESENSIEDEEEDLAESFNESAEMSEKDKLALKRALMSLPLYEQVKECIRGSKLPGARMSVQTIKSKLMEKYAVDAFRNMGLSDELCSMCEYTPISKYIISEEEEKAELKNISLGDARRFLKSGMDKVWEARRQNELNSNLQAVINAQNENVDDAKKAVDKYTTEGESGKKKIMAAAELLTDNETDKEEVIDYAINKMAEDGPLSSASLLRRSGNAVLGHLTASTGIEGIMSVPRHTR